MDWKNLLKYGKRMALTAVIGTSSLAVHAQNNAESTDSTIKTEIITPNDKINDIKADLYKKQIQELKSKTSKERINRLFTIAPQYAFNLIKKLDEQAKDLKPFTTSLNDYFNSLPEEKQALMGFALTQLAIRGFNPKKNEDEISNIMTEISQEYKNEETALNNLNRTAQFTNTENTAETVSDTVFRDNDKIYIADGVTHIHEDCINYKDIKNLFISCPTPAYDLICKLDKTTPYITPISSQKIADYYQRLPEQKRILFGTALTDLAQQKLSPKTTKDVMNHTVDSIYNKYKPIINTDVHLVKKVQNENDFPRTQYSDLTPEQQQRIDRLRSIEDLSYEVVGRFEGFKCIASKNPADDTIDTAFGNHTHPDGTKVKNGDKLKAEPKVYFGAYNDDHMYKELAKHFPIENMSPEQIVGVVLFAYNVGTGKLVANNKLTNLGQNLCTYFTSNDLEAIKKAETTIRSINTAKGKPLKELTRRRDFELRLIQNKISLTDPEAENYVNAELLSVNAVHLSALCKTLPTDEYISQMLTAQGDTLNTYIDKKMQAQPRPTYNRNSKPKPKPKTLAGVRKQRSR